MNFRIVFNYLLYILIVAAVSSCGTSATDDDSLNVADPAHVQVEKNNKVQKIFSTIQSQSETSGMLEAAGARYDSKLLNAIENVSKYSSIKAKALNLGVYGLDLGVTNIFNQTQESMLYLKCTNKLATSLGISGAFDEKMSNRIDANSDSKDSLLAIITDSYRNSDNYLQENGQAGVSTLMVAGGWIEGLYISSQLGNTTKNQAIKDRVAKEKPTLDVLISLLESYKKENEGTEELLASLIDLKKVFDSVSITPAANAAPADKTGGSSADLVGATVKITEDQFKQILDKTAAIRNKIIQ